MAKTYLWLQDAEPADPQKDTTPLAFDVYNEAMSFGKFITTNELGSHINSYIWNYDGGSGYWSDGSWSDLDNTNYP